MRKIKNIVQENLKIRYVPINSLKVATYNPRKISDFALSQLKESIARFGTVDPIIVNSAPNRKNVVIGGHMRLRASKELGMKSMPVVYLNISDLKKEKELNLRLNKNIGEWDFEKLKSFEMDTLTDIGFSDKDLLDMWSENLEAENDNFDELKELTKIKKPKTERGDLIILGQHKLLCADSTDPNAVKVLFGKDRASVIYSDPPFNIGLNYNKGVGNKSHYGGEVDDNKSPDEYKNFIEKTLVNALSVSNKDIHCFYWCDEAWVWIFQTLYNKLGIKNRRLNIWLKNNSSPCPNTAFNKAIEVCCYGTHGSPYLSNSLKNLNEVMNKELTNGNELLEDVTNILAVKRLPSNQYEHPTSKPPSLHEKSIKRCSKVGDIIFDSFSGSASTMICAEQLNRKVYSLEMSEIFCDLAIRRWEKLTGKKVKIIKKFYEKN